MEYLKLGGGNSNIFLFSPLLGEDSHFDEYFSIGLKPPPSESNEQKPLVGWGYF